MTPPVADMDLYRSAMDLYWADMDLYRADVDLYRPDLASRGCDVWPMRARSVLGLEKGTTPIHQEWRHGTFVPSDGPGFLGKQLYSDQMTLCHIYIYIYIYIYI